MKNKIKSLLKKIAGLAMIFFIAITSSCTKENQVTTPINPASTGGGTVKTSVMGIVVDESNQAVSGANVIAYGYSTTTDSKGFFMLNNINVPAKRGYIKVSKTAYFPGSRSVIPAANGITQVDVMMLSNAPVTSFSASTGGDATLSNGCKVEIPANAVVDANGNAYSGTVNVALKHLDPESPDFSRYMPGDLQAIGSNGDEATLVSYGMLAVELTGTSGQHLQIANGKQAVITTTVPSSMISTAPGSIPLWYFDENAGIWKEEGQATLVGNQYVGNVAHFSFWNCDDPYPSATINVTVVDCNGYPLAGIVIQSSTGGWITTDGNGQVSTLCPAGINFILGINSTYSPEITAPPVSVGPLAPGETYTVTITTSCPTSLKGTIVDCNNNPVAGYVLLVWANGGSTTATTSTGHFKIAVKGNQAATIYAYSSTGVSLGSAVTTPSSAGATTDIGTLTTCSEGMVNSFYVTGGSYNNQLFTITQDFTSSGSRYYSSNNYTYINIFQTWSDPGFIHSDINYCA